ncbi:MAG: hypothetical protein ACI9EF_001912 [Pseudohongiellaceae bacterium]|jgi:hypothetical protein
MSRTCCALLITCCALLSACGPGSINDSVTALQNSFNAKDFPAVIAAAGPLLERCEAEKASSGVAWRVEKLRLQALASEGEGAKSLAKLEELDGAYEGKVDAALYNKICGMVTETGAYQEALSILDAGQKKYPEMEAVFLPQIAKLKDSILNGGSDAAKAMLKQLGYL